MSEPERVSLAQGTAHLLQELDGSGRGLWPIQRHEMLERYSVEVLHGVVEDAVGGAAEVEDGDGVGVSQRARQPHFLLKAPHRLLTGAIRWQELDRRWPAQERVPGQIHDEIGRA